MANYILARAQFSIISNLSLAMPKGTKKRVTHDSQGCQKSSCHRFVSLGTKLLLLQMTRMNACYIYISYVMAEAWKFRHCKLTANYYIPIPTYFLHGKLLTHQDFLLAKIDVAYEVFLYFGQEILLIDLSFQGKKGTFHKR